MNKNINKLLKYIPILIYAIIYNTIIFMLSNEKDINFWFTFIFSLVAVIIQVIVTKVFSNEDLQIKDLFLGMPIVHTSIMYLLIQSILGFIFIMTPNLNGIVAIIIQMVVLGIELTLLISGVFAKNNIKHVEGNIEKKVDYINNVKVDIEIAMSRIKDKIVLEKMKELKEIIEYSDPMSNDSLVTLEKEISDNVSSIKNFIVNKSEIEVVNYIEEIINLVKERNIKCKLYKGR